MDKAIKETEQGQAEELPSKRERREFQAHVHDTVEHRNQGQSPERGAAMLILVDQDGVLADFEKAFLTTWRGRHPELPYVPVENRNVFYVRDQYPAAHKDLVHAVHTEEGFYRNLPVIDGAVEAMEEMLAAGHEVFICTSPLTSNLFCASEKHAWIQEHLGKKWLKRTIIASDKTLVGGGTTHPRSILVDDRPKVEGLCVPSWTHVVFDAPYNHGVQGPRLTAWSRWRDDLASVLA